MPHSTPRRRMLATALSVMLAVLGLAVLDAPAASAAVYRYWGYFHGDGNGGWTFAKTGPASYVPKNGSVEGWRYAAVGKKTRFPRTSSSYDAVCPTGTQTPAGGKAVAVYLDFGLASEAPSGSTPPEPLATCVVTDADATGAQVLAQAAKVRTQKGLTCAIDGYPASGCGDQLSKAPDVKVPEPTVRFAVATPGATPTTAPTAAPSGSTAATATDQSHTVRYVLIAILVAVVLGLGGAFLAGRNRT